MAEFFPGCLQKRIDTGPAQIFARSGGSGPAVLFLHGYPQTHVMWHGLAKPLMEEFACVFADLRGYGFSSCPPNEPGNLPYSKRAMAQDMLAVMTALGHPRFAVVGHDRGARVGYRLALDHPEAVTALAVLDIVSTYDMWRKFTVALAMKTYHWLFLAQPFPLPEMLIEPNPAAYLDYTIASWTKTKDLSAFDPDALAEYRLHYATPEHVHATCNDYRAGQTCDLAFDEADRAKGRKITCPTLALWGESGIPSAVERGTGVETNPLAAWGQWCLDLSGAAIDAGHFLPEENPGATLDQLLRFLRRHAGKS
jgi:haloacetate dehalogenase